MHNQSQPGTRCEKQRLLELPGGGGRWLPRAPQGTELGPGEGRGEASGRPAVRMWVNEAALQLPTPPDSGLSQRTRAPAAAPPEPQQVPQEHRARKLSSLVFL